MIKKIIYLIIGCCSYGFTNPIIDLCEEAQAFFSCEDDNQPSLDEAVSYVIDLRAKIEELGYEVPAIEEMIFKLDEQFQVNGLSRQMKIAFSAEESLGGLSGHFYCCGQNEDDVDWGTMCVGGCEMLGGALLAIIPFQLTRTIAAGMIMDGLHRILNATEERAKLNICDGTHQYERRFYD